MKPRSLDNTTGSFHSVYFLAPLNLPRLGCAPFLPIKNTYGVHIKLPEFGHNTVPSQHVPVMVGHGRKMQPLRDECTIDSDCPTTQRFEAVGQLPDDLRTCLQQEWCETQDAHALSESQTVTIYNSTFWTRSMRCPFDTFTLDSDCRRRRRATTSTTTERASHCNTCTGQPFL